MMHHASYYWLKAQQHAESMAFFNVTTTRSRMCYRTGHGGFSNMDHAFFFFYCVSVNDIQQKQVWNTTITPSFCKRNAHNIGNFLVFTC